MKRCMYLKRLSILCNPSDSENAVTDSVLLALPPLSFSQSMPLESSFCIILVQPSNSMPRKTILNPNEQNMV